MKHPQKPIRILFLCTGNSARSQMAEAWVRARWGDRWEAFSAGTKPAGYVHPMAIAVMEELGIPMEHARSKSIQEFLDQSFDWVITVCDQAAETCPVWPGRGQRVHMGFPDPAAAEGPPEVVRQVFRDVRDAIIQKLEAFRKQVETFQKEGV